MDRNFIIHQEAHTYEWSGDCFLSVKSFYKGNANYQIKQRAYAVDSTNFLILNECTKYRLTIDSTEKTGSFCVFFAPGYVTQVVAELQSSDEELLDFKPKKYGGIRLFERNYRRQGPVARLLQIGRTKSERGMSTMEQDEFYLHLLNAIIAQDRRNHLRIHRLHAKKTATRKELYQRLCFVKDFIDCHYREDLSLHELAQVGLLSENHLLRNFSQLVGLTPFQYISRKRIQEAQRLLLQDNSAVKDIALQLGYTSFGNFSSYFKKVTGKSPTEFRKK